MNIDDIASESGNVEFDLWKQRISKSFSDWLGSLSPDKLTERESADEPDLYSFFAALTALQTETRKLSRKSADSLASFSDTMERIESFLVKKEPDQPPCSLGILGIYDRIMRIKEKLGSAPSQRKLFNDNRWAKYHSTISEAMNLLEINYRDLLKAMGFVRIESKGQRFDPERMVAVEAQNNSSLPDNTVIEELSPGYVFGGKIVRVAEVKVARKA
jgi:hypothetical protein